MGFVKNLSKLPLPSKQVGGKCGAGQSVPAGRRIRLITCVRLGTGRFPPPSTPHKPGRDYDPPNGLGTHAHERAPAGYGGGLASPAPQWWDPWGPLGPRAGTPRAALLLAAAGAFCSAPPDHRSSYNHKGMSAAIKRKVQLQARYFKYLAQSRGSTWSMSRIVVVQRTTST